MAAYHMYKQECEITDHNSLLDILLQGKFTTLALCREHEPYLITLNYGYDRERHALYFHSALQGLKLDFLQGNPKVCGTIVEDRGYLLHQCAHAYRSLVFRGEMRVVEELDEKKHGMQILLAHLEEEPKPILQRNLNTDAAYQNVAILRVDIHDMTGKAGQ